MKYLFIMFALLGTGLYSCQSRQQDNHSDLALSYTTIYSSFQIYKGVQQKFINKASVPMYVLMNDKHAAVDTRELRLLLDSAREAGESQLAMIRGVSEPDEEIGYKRKSLDYIEMLDSLYHHEFPEYIRILETDSADRYEKCQAVLLPALKSLQGAGEECAAAGRALHRKYGIQIIDSLNPPHPLKPAPIDGPQ